jgi:hypothetical protein
MRTMEDKFFQTPNTATKQNTTNKQDTKKPTTTKKVINTKNKLLITSPTTTCIYHRPGEAIMEILGEQALSRHPDRHRS